MQFKLQSEFYPTGDQPTAIKELVEGKNTFLSSSVVRAFTGDGSDTTFTVTSGVTADNILVMVEGLVMLPTTDYSVSGTTLTFTTAPSVGDKIDIRELPA